LSSFLSLQLLLFRSRKNDRESRALGTESERQSKLCHELEKELHSLEKEEINLQNSLRDQKRLAEDVSRLKEELNSLSAQSKVNIKISIQFTLNF